LEAGSTTRKRKRSNKKALWKKICKSIAQWKQTTRRLEFRKSVGGEMTYKSRVESLSQETRGASGGVLRTEKGQREEMGAHLFKTRTESL